MNLELLEDFLELARELNFSRAATNRNMTQPAFSRRIRSLETELQTPLIHRTTRQVSLTAAGKAFLPHAASIVRRLSVARIETAEAAGQTQRSLNLAATHALSYTFVPRWLLKVSAPGEFGALNLVSDTQRQCIRLMVNGETHFFLTHKSPGPLPDLPEKLFPCHVVGRDVLIPLCAPDAAGNPRWTLSGRSQDVPFISYGAASGLHGILETHWSVHGRPRLTPKMSSVLAATNLEMAKEGQGVSYLPQSLAESEIANGRLVQAGSLSDAVPVEIALYRHRSRQSPHCEAFWNRIRNGSGTEIHTHLA